MYELKCLYNQNYLILIIALKLSVYASQFVFENIQIFNKLVKIDINRYVLY